MLSVTQPIAGCPLREGSPVRQPPSSHQESIAAPGTTLFAAMEWYILSNLHGSTYMAAVVHSWVRTDWVSWVLVQGIQGGARWLASCPRVTRMTHQLTGGAHRVEPTVAPLQDMRMRPPGRAHLCGRAMAAVWVCGGGFSIAPPAFCMSSEDLPCPAAKSGSVHVWLQLLVSELVGGLVSGGVWTSACTTSHVICVLHATTQGRFTCGRSPSACARSIEASGRGMYVPIQGGKPGPPPFIRAARAPLHERMQR